MAAANANMRFTKTNDIISTDYVSIDPTRFRVWLQILFL
jgi:phage terminase large subunit